MLRINLKYRYIDTINLDLDKLEDDEERFEIKEIYLLKQKVIVSILSITVIRRTELVKNKILIISFKDNSIF